jgi:aryl-alcohol dehydrogenase-like predicted oxidoreductase
MEITNNLRPLGHTGIIISPIGLGCWQFSKQNNLISKAWYSNDPLISPA